MALSDAQMSQFMAAQQAAQREQVLYSFNCGSMELSPSKSVTADSRKGKVVLTVEDDGLLRFSWRLRHKDENEQQYFVFPDGATWTRVAECKDGCVFLLKFRDSDVRRFFWSQEPKGDGAAKKETEILRRVSALLVNPPKFGAPLPTEAELAAAAAKDEDEAMTDVASVGVTAGDSAAIQGTGATQPSPVSEAHRGVHAHPEPGTVVPQAGAAATPSPSPPAAAASASSSATLNANNLMSTLNAMAQQLQARQEEQASAAQTGVEDVLDAERVQAILDVDSALVESLVEFLPEGQRSPDALRAQLRSPQMQQTMTRLTSILNSSQFGQLMASLSLPVGASTGLGVDAFLAAIQAQAAKQQGAEKK